ncbi:MAG: SIR2 family protein [Prevotellaceae bacterium]|nr:SIR2 family protein [Candidatus Faecinaster equi]
MGKFSSIIEHIRKEDVVLFVGAGCSIQAGALTANQLSVELAKFLPEDTKAEIDTKNLQKVAEAVILNDGNRDKVNALLRKSLEGLTPGEFHKQLSNIPHIHNIITTNYDSLIEDAYWGDRCQVFRNDGNCPVYKDNKVHLFKIHGDLQALDRIVISESDYRNFIKEPTDSIIWSKILSEMAMKTVVFVGYAVEDGNVLNLLEDILNKVGGHRKKMFIVSPSVTRTQGKRLQQLGINHVVGTGEEFVADTIKEIKDNFGFDKEDNVCSQDTLSLFGLLNGIYFSLENRGDHTSITGMRAKNGSLLHQLHFNTKSLDILSDTYTKTTTELIKGFEVPYKSLTPEELKTFEHRVNGIRVNGQSDYSKVLIGPAIIEETAEFQSVKAHFRFQHKVRRYGTGQEAHICIDGEMCLIEYILSVPKEDKDSISGKINITFKDTFKNIDEAIKWADLLIAMVDNDDFVIKLPKATLPTITFPKNGISEVYHDVKSYFENIIEIERVGEFMFDEYEQYTPDSFMVSKMVLSFLKKKPFIDKPREGLRHISMNIAKGKFDNKPGFYFVRLVTNMNGAVELNSKKFEIEEERAFLKKCSIKSVNESNPEFDTIEIDNMEDEVQYEYVKATEPDLLIDGKVEE